MSTRNRIRISKMLLGGWNGQPDEFWRLGSKDRWDTKKEDEGLDFI